jgi:hypothetical protein
MRQGGGPEVFGQAIAIYKQALAIDPTYAPAWDLLADAYYAQSDFGVITTDQGLPTGPRGEQPSARECGFLTTGREGACRERRHDGSS